MAKVTFDLKKPGKAAESLTAQAIGKCCTSVARVKVMKVGAKNLPRFSEARAAQIGARASAASRRKPSIDL
ncbi:MAG TPA: hypothetical protein VFQ44_11055 [Streptosporangiaceae bacterium]|nr:hypothetical protein [Streptosporangiaceae bacterium]